MFDNLRLVLPSSFWLPSAMPCHSPFGAKAGNLGEGGNNRSEYWNQKR